MTDNDTSTVSFTAVRYLTLGMQRSTPSEATVFDRYLRIPGTDMSALENAHVVQVGGGGLGSEVCHGLVRKGCGRVTIFDADTVEPSNLQRQLFGPEDVSKNKALALARNLARHATGRTLLEGYAYRFQEAAAHNGGMSSALDGDIAIVGVDNHEARIAAAAYYLARRTPVVFLAVDVLAASGYVFVQTSRPKSPCFLCLYLDAAQDSVQHRCAGASIEILKVMAGIALYAVDSLLMARPRPWNYKEVSLDRSGDGAGAIAQRPNCGLCAQSSTSLTRNPRQA